MGNRVRMSSAKSSADAGYQESVLLICLSNLMKIVSLGEPVSKIGLTVRA